MKMLKSFALCILLFATLNPVISRAGYYSNTAANYFQISQANRTNGTFNAILSSAPGSSNYNYYAYAYAKNAYIYANAGYSYAYNQYYATSTTNRKFVTYIQASHLCKIS